MQEAKSALLIDDSADFAEGIEICLLQDGWRVEICHSRDAALGVLQQRSFTLILLDYWMPGMTAEEFVPKARKLVPEALIVLMTSDYSAFEIASKLGIGEVFQKPFDGEFLISNLKRVNSAKKSVQRKRVDTPPPPMLRGNLLV